MQLQNLGERYVLTLANNLFIQQGFELQQVSYLHLLTAVALTSSFPVTVSLTVVFLMCILEHLMCFLEPDSLQLVGKRQEFRLSVLLVKKSHPVAINGYRAKIKQESVCFWHMLTRSRRCDYSQTRPIQAVCKLFTSGLASGMAGAAVSLERAYHLRCYTVSRIGLLR